MTAPPVPSSPRLADRLLLLALDPADGRIHGGRSLDVSLRAALLAELGLRGVVTSDGRAPQLGPLSGQLAGQTRGELAASPSAATGDHVLDAVAATIGRRPGVAWKRWFRHVAADRTAVAAELVAAGRWTPQPGRDRFADRDPAASERLAGAVAVAAAGAGAAPVGDLLLAILSDLGSHPGPRTRRARLRTWEPVLVRRLEADGFQPGPRAAVLAALSAAAAVRTFGLLPR